MKLKKGFITRQMGGKQVMVSVDRDTFSGLVRSNDTAAFMVDCLKKETTRSAVVEAVLEHYEVDRPTAERDVDRVLEKLRSIRALEE